MSEKSSSNRGVGPGPITGDGCAVELYFLLPYNGEVELLEAFLRPAASILELGCGVGRMTRALLACGYRMTAVDNSLDMLSHVPDGAVKVCSDIESLDLDKRFDAVLLASCLVNVPEESARRALLEACSRHLAIEGKLFFQRFDPDWLANAKAGESFAAGDVHMAVDEIRWDGMVAEICLRYEADGKEWRHYFSAILLDDSAVAESLSETGFGDVQWINRTWGCARRAA